MSVRSGDKNNNILKVNSKESNNPRSKRKEDLIFDLLP